jgi:hypothetical protein
LKFNYKLVDVKIEGFGNDTKLLNRAFFSALNSLAFATKGPTAFAYNNGKRYVAVRADAQLKPMTIPGSPMNIRLTPVDGIFHLNTKSIDEENLDLAIRFLDSEINWQLNKNSFLWDAGGNTFLKKIPLPLSKQIEKDIYQGFKFRIVAEDKDNVFICLDLAYRYAQKKTIYELLKSVPKERHHDLVANHNILYQNGDDWYTVKGKSIAGSIAEHKIVVNNKNISVYDYIRNEGKYANARFKNPLIRNSETLIYSYSGKTDKTFAGATCLSKLISYAEDGLHRNSINEPNKRFFKAQRDVEKFFSNLSFNGMQLSISTHPYNKECKVFNLPSLKYGRNAILNPYERTLPYGDAIDNFPKRRREYVYKNGIFTETPFQNQYLFVPDNISIAFGKALKYYFDKTMKKIAPQFKGFILHQYSAKQLPYAHKVFTDFKKYIEQNNLAGGAAIFVLPEELGDNGSFVKYLHKIVKKELFGTINIKCVSASNLQRYLKIGVNPKYPFSFSVPDGLMRDFISYQSYTLFDFLIINKKWAFTLAEKLHHDLYIGIDAHEFYAGFCFFFGNGDKIVFEVDKISKGTGTYRNEKINYKVIADKIYAVLERHLKVADEKPKSIVILRDGVSYGEEERALSDALQRLSDINLLDIIELKTGVIDVAKSTGMPVRAAKVQNGNPSLQNPDCGTYFMLNKKDAFIFNTGKPYNVPGSSKPIHVSFTSGNIDFEKALEDIFRLTQIAFSAPDRPSSLPLPLKLIDTLIRDVAHEHDFAFTQEKEIKLFEPSLN